VVEKREQGGVYKAVIVKRALCEGCNCGREEGTGRGVAQYNEEGVGRSEVCGCEERAGRCEVVVAKREPERVLLW
jgi:hypothetical protein